MKTKILILILFMLTIVGCRKSEPSPRIQVTPVPPVSFISNTGSYAITTLTYEGVDLTSLFPSDISKINRIYDLETGHRVIVNGVSFKSYLLSYSPTEFYNVVVIKDKDAVMMFKTGVEGNLIYISCDDWPVNTAYFGHCTEFPSQELKNAYMIDVWNIAPICLYDISFSKVSMDVTKITNTISWKDSNLFNSECSNMLSHWN